MAQSLQRAGKLEADRKTRFSQKFLKDTEVLIGMVSSEIAEKHIKVSGCYLCGRGSNVGVVSIGRSQCQEAEYKFGFFHSRLLLSP